MFDMILNGGIMMIPILICSIVTISIAIERYKYFKRHTMLYAIYAIQDAMHNIDLMNTVNRDYESCKWLKEMITSSDCKRKDFVESSAMLYLMEFKNGLGLLKMIVTISPLLGLLGTILSILFRSICSVLYTIMDPNAFDTIQSVMFTNFNSIDISILPACGLMVLAATLSIYFLHKELDVISLGENLSKSLGVDREEVIIYIIIMISILVSVSTSLVGPIVFIGLFVSNLTRIMFNTYKHKFLLVASMLIGINLLLGGVYLNDLVFTDTNLPVVIDGLGALYFIYLCITKRSKIL